MAINISNEDYKVIKQQYIVKYLRLNILDFKFNVVNELSGRLTGCSIQCNADSDIRRTCSVDMVVTDTSLDIQPGGQIFLDKYCQPYVGYEDIYTGEIQWYNQGIYMINQPSFQYSATTHTLSFSGIDLMGKMTGVRNGNLEGLPTVIPQGSNVREAMIATIGLAGFNNYIIEECKLNDGTIQPVPYDIEIQQGGTVYNILTELRDIMPNYQIYFDVNGVFHYEPIPDGKDDPILIDDDLWPSVLIQENVSTDFESVKNYVEVYGKSHDVDHYPSEISVSGSDITLTIASLPTAIDKYTMIGFTTPEGSAISGNITIKVNSLEAIALVDSSGKQIQSLDANTYYVAYYQPAENNVAATWLFLGHQQATAVSWDDNPDSPFYVDGPVGRIRIVLYGGDYDNIMSDELAKQRADVEVYWRCRLNDSISLSCVPIPWMDVNIVVSHAMRGHTEQNKYIIKSYSVDYGSETGQMTINAITFYEYYK